MCLRRDTHGGMSICTTQKPGAGNASEPWKEQSSSAGRDAPMPAACANPVTPLPSSPADCSADGVRPSPGAVVAALRTSPQSHSAPHNTAVNRGRCSMEGNSLTRSGGSAGGSPVCRRSLHPTFRDQRLKVSANSLGQSLPAPWTSAQQPELTQNCYGCSTELPAPHGSPERQPPRQSQLCTPTRPLPGAPHPHRHYEPPKQLEG